MTDLTKRLRSSAPTTDETNWRTQLRSYAAQADIAHAINLLAETPLTAGQITIAIAERRRALAAEDHTHD